jgi:integrase/recombinase XerD
VLKDATELDSEQVMDYLHLVKSNGSPSATFFKFTVYGMRYACKLRGLPYQQFSLPSIERNDKLLVVLNASDVKALLKVCDLLGFLYFTTLPFLRLLL